MADPKPVLIKLTQNLNILREREAKYGGNAPPELLNQIEDHEKAIALTEQAIDGKLSHVEWCEVMKPLLIAIDARSGEAASSVTIGDIQGGIYGSEIAGRDISIGQKIVNIFTGDTSQQRDQRNRQVILRAVKEFWVKGVLENSLHNAVLLELGMGEKREAIAYPWEMVLQSPHRPNCILPPDTRMIDIFDQYQTLLILGEPGSGKTTMLLELTRQTIARAETDSTQPIPVVFNLSSWQPERLKKYNKTMRPLDRWLVEELYTKYNIPPKIAQTWVDNDKLLLLLDGLDEVAQPHRVACVEAINTFRQNSLMPVVVCSRVTDYEKLVVKLNLAQAIALQPLTFEQIDEYLARFGTELSALKVAFQQDSNLLELAQSPLLLSVMALAYRGLSVEDLKLPNTIETHHKHIFDTYVQRMFERRGSSLRYSQTQTIKWLTWLAQRLAQHFQTVFLIEKIQPSWLQTPVLKRLYFVFYEVMILLTGGLIGLFIFGLFGMPYLGLVVGLLSGLITGIFDWLITKLEIHPVEAFKWSWKQPRKKVLFHTLLGLFSIMMIGEIIGGLVNELKVGPKFGIIIFLLVVLSFRLSGRLSYKLLFGIIIGGLFGLQLGLFGGLIGFVILWSFLMIFGGLGYVNNVETTMTSNQGIWQSAKNSRLAGLIIGLSAGLLGGMIAWLEGKMDSLTGGLIMVMFMGFLGMVSFGGGTFVKHFVLRFILWRKDYTPALWDFVDFLDYCTDRIFLRKVGGGYIFIHRYLMEYFASLEPEQTK